MTQNYKTLTNKQKLIIYILAAVLAFVAAIISVIILVHILKNPPDIIVNSSITSYIANSVSVDPLPSPDIQQVPDDNVNPDAPKINGVKNGAVYYTTQYVTVSGDNLKSVEINGDANNSHFYIDGNNTNVYVIEAIDKHENITTYIIYTKPISTLLEPISHLNKNTVTADDYDTINNVRKTALGLDTKYSSPDEINSINDIVNTCDRFINKIDSVAKKIADIENKVKNYETTGEYADVNQVTISIDALFSTENLTSEQRSTLNKLYSKCLSWLNNFSQTEPIYENVE